MHISVLLPVWSELTECSVGMHKRTDSEPGAETTEHGRKSRRSVLLSIQPAAWRDTQAALTWINARSPQACANSGTREHTMSGELEVLDQVRKSLRSEPRVRPAGEPIHLSYRDGELLMEGEVDHIAGKKLALERA